MLSRWALTAVAVTMPTRTLNGPTFLLGWIDALPEAPVGTAAGNLGDVELAHRGVSLKAREGELQPSLSLGAQVHPSVSPH